MTPIAGPMTGRTVLVTGATGGIGKATALGLATMGARVAITGRDRDRTEAAAREIRAGRRRAGRRVRRGPVRPVRGATTGRRGAAAPPATRCAGQQRRRVTGTPGTSPPTGSSAPSRSTTSRRSCSPTSSSTG